MPKVYTLKYHFGWYGYENSHNIISSLDKTKVEEEASRILAESEQYKKDKLELQNKIGKYYQEELVNNNLVPSGYFNNSQAVKSLYHYIEDRFLSPKRACSGLISDLFHKPTGLPEVVTPEYYFCRYPGSNDKAAINLAFSIPEETLNKIMDGKPKAVDIKVPEIYAEPDELIIQETSLI